MLLKSRQVAILFICLFFMGVVFTQPSKFTVSETQSFLEFTENVRLTDYPMFLKNMVVLESTKSSFSNNQQCFFQYLKSYHLSYQGQFDTAKKKIKKLINGCQDENVYIRLNSLLANISAISGDYNQAVSRVDDILSKINEIKDPQLKYQIYPTAFMVYRLVNQAELSIKFSDLMIDENPPKHLLCKALANKNLSQFKLDNQIINDDKVQETIDICMESKQTIYAQLLLIYWLSEEMQASDSPVVYQRLLDKLKSNEAVIEETKFTNIIGIKNSLMAQLYEKLDQLESAKKYAQIAIKGSISIGETVQKIKALDVLVNYYQKQGNYKIANEYLIKKISSEKKYNTNEQAKVMAFQTVKHNSLADTYKINALSQENKLLQLESQLAEKSKRNQQLINLLFIFIVAFFIFFAYRLVKQQKKFKKLSELDHMTFIYNRKGIKDYMAYLLPYSEKKNELIGYVIFDLDLFKRVNDVYGHVVGDWVIKQSVKVCKDLKNKKATFARLGGEEFSIVIRDSSIDETIAFSEQCRKAIDDINTLDGTNHDFDVSASFGITTSEISGYDYTKLMTHADNALYYSKENGRNRLTIYHQ